MDAFLAEAYGNDDLFYLFVFVDLMAAVLIAVTMINNFNLINAIKDGRIDDESVADGKCYD